MLCLKTTGSSSDPSGSSTRAQGRRGKACRTPCPTEGPVQPPTPTLQSSFELWHFRRRHALHDLLMVRQAQRDVSKWPWPEEAFHVGSRCASGGSGSNPTALWLRGCRAGGDNVGKEAQIARRYSHIPS